MHVEATPMTLARPLAALLLGAGFLGCKGTPGEVEREDHGGGVAAGQVLAHQNAPPVRLDKTGPARFVHRLYREFDKANAMRLVAHMDQRIRTPGSPGFGEVLDEMAAQLRAAGYGSREHFELSELVTAMDEPSWWPLRARLAIALPSGEERVLHAFEDPSSLDRCMLPRHAPAASIRGQVSFALDTLDEGEILVTRTRLRPDLLARARSRGAIGIVSASLGDYNVDPTGRNRHLDAVQYRELPSTTDLPVVQISERSYALIEQQKLRDGSVTLAFDAEVENGPDVVRAVVATVRGARQPDEAVLIVSHVQEPGASDNASGAAGTLESALVLARLIAAGELARPARSVVFLFGMEMVSSKAWLESTELSPVAGVCPVMTGNSRAETGAVPLLERHPDPASIEVLPPDQHSVWGARPVDPEWLERPNGLSVIGRCALVDVSLACGGWETFENPYEGGTDHELLIGEGVPAVLFWHFTDFTFHTSLDRIAMVDAEEMQRTSVAALATALAVAAPEPRDLDRYLKSNLDELHLRRDAALEAGLPDLAEEWERWCTGVRHWFRELCLGPER